jgi:hypothetical protein
MNLLCLGGSCAPHDVASRDALTGCIPGESSRSLMLMYDDELVIYICVYTRAGQPGSMEAGLMRACFHKIAFSIQNQELYSAYLLERCLQSHRRRTDTYLAGFSGLYK